MTEQQSTQGIERIVFEPVRDGQWRMRLEGADVEGHGYRAGWLSVESTGKDEDGEALYSVSFEGEDVEGQGARYH